MRDVYNERRQLVTEYSRARCDTTHEVVVSPAVGELVVIRVHRGRSHRVLPAVNHFIHCQMASQSVSDRESTYDRQNHPLKPSGVFMGCMGPTAPRIWTCPLQVATHFLYTRPITCHIK